MAAIAAPEEAVERYITKLGIRDRAVVAVYNATDGHVVSGEKGAVESVLSAAKMDGLRGTKLNIDQGRRIHSCPSFLFTDASLTRFPQSCNLGSSS